MGRDALTVAAGCYLLLQATPVGTWIAIAAARGSLDAGPSGSTDSALGWFSSALWLAVSVVAGLVAFRRARPLPPGSSDAVIEAARLFLGAELLFYGLAKTVGTQMAPPSLLTLMTPLGEMPPMHLMWTFFGFSPTYQAFTGAAELFFGGLLLSRRAATLGALGAVGVMSNVFLMNLCYDVPVKRLSGTMLAIALGLLAVEWRPLWAFWFTTAAVPRRELRPALARRAAWAWRAAKLALVALVVGPAVSDFGPRAPPAVTPDALAGVWRVDEGPEGWHQVGFFWGLVVVEARDGLSVAGAELDGDQLRLVRYPDAVGALRLEHEGDDLRLTGELGGAPLEVRLTGRRREAELPLHARGFRWISDVHHNRLDVSGEALRP